MDLDKLKKIASKSGGGAGGPRRKAAGKGKASGSSVDAKVKSAARSLKAQEIHPEFDDVMLVRKDGSAVGILKPRLDAKLESNMFVVATGGIKAQERSAMEVTSRIMEQDQMAMTHALQSMGMGSLMEQADQRLATMPNGGEGMTPEQMHELVQGLQIPTPGDDDGDDVPDLVGNFEEVSA